MRVPRALWLPLLALVLLIDHPARADVAGAARAFSEGQAAQMEGDYALAAQRYELADMLSPSKEALRSAARMRMSAGHLARAATHAEGLLSRFGEDPAAVSVASEILSELRPKLTRYEVSCKLACSLSVDGRAWFVDRATQHVLYLEPKPASFEVSYGDGRTSSRSVSGRAGEQLQVAFDEPPSAASSPVAPSGVLPTGPVGLSHAEPRAPESGHGLPITVPVTTGIATLIAGAAATWASVDTTKQHDRYVQNPTQQGWDDGMSRQRLANVLWASTAVLGTTTVVLSFFTNWGGKQKVAVASRVSQDGAAVALVGKF
jgi:hypothetical protein